MKIVYTINECLECKIGSKTLHEYNNIGPFCINHLNKEMYDKHRPRKIIKEESK